MTKTGVALSSTNLDYIARRYPTEFQKLQEECLNISGAHKITKQYSVTGYIESDHTIPHNVWQTTTNPKMKKLVKGSGSRPGENGLPAITIPYKNHRKLRTTGSSDDAKIFVSLLLICAMKIGLMQL